ncbi:MAG: hypothetical protein ACPGTU_18740 [Myxococcota bacterium]
MRQIGTAAALFLINAALSVWWMWDARPRTWSSVEALSIDSDEIAHVESALTAAALTAREVLVCEVEPCTASPAVYVLNGKVVRIELMQADRHEPRNRAKP